MAIAPPGQPAHHKAGAAPHHKPHAGHHPDRARKRRRRLVVLSLSLVALGAFGVWLVSGPNQDKLTPEQQLVEQMHLAASGGAVAPTHALDGKLVVVRGERGVTVQADGLESKACVSVGWRLAPDGIVTVNGTTPARLSGAKLSELCAQAENGLSTLSWVPKE